MLDIIDKVNCIGCHACFSVCPKQCISMQTDGEGFLYPKIDKKICIECGLCEKVCPILSSIQVFTEPKAYAVVNKNLEQRMHSSSGGIFILLAEYVISKKGVVFGAKFDAEFQVVHDYAETLEDILEFRGSKYVQSRIGNTYIKAKEFLERGREVLFTGTPCQIAGLRAYLGKTYANLLTADVICHGSPSPEVWRKYVEYRENIAGASTQQMLFRYKKYGWKAYAVLFQYSNSTVYEKMMRKDLYMHGFLKNIYLRPSCYDCKFKGERRFGDITLGDFWGIQNVLPEMDDDKGTSLVLINSEKGKKVFDTIEEFIIYKEVPVEVMIKYNSAAVKSVERSSRREAFFTDLGKLSSQKLFEKYGKDNLKEKGMKFLKKCFRKMKKL